MISAFDKFMRTSDEVTGPLNLGNPVEHKILDLAKMILELTGSRSKIVHRPLPKDDPQQRRPDITQAEQLLGWRPTVELGRGLQKTIMHFEAVLAGG
jgi:UDP-glucuronate decarboxylase